MQGGGSSKSDKVQQWLPNTFGAEHISMAWFCEMIIRQAEISGLVAPVLDYVFMLNKMRIGI